MRKMTVLFALFSSLLLAACAAPSKSSAPSGAIVKTSKVLEIEQKQRAREEALQDLKDRKKVLNKKSELDSSSSVKLSAVPQNKKIVLNAPYNQKPRSDRELYAELVGSFDRNNEIAFFSRFQSFQQNYARSPLADDAIYLAGLMSLSNKNYGPALQYFNQVLKKYPTSNKASASLFAKGVALKKMNLTDESRQVFAKVQKAYPGSPEAMRAETELKLVTRK